MRLFRSVIQRTLALAIFVGALRAASAQTAPPIRLNTVGYLPDAPKVATAVGPGHFSVVRISDGRIALEGEAARPILNSDTGEQLATVDFSAVREPGEYRVRVAGLGESAPFRIAADLYREPLLLVTRAMYLWRCGVAVDADWQGQHFHHDACHLEDAWLDHVTGQHERSPSTGGWHDAGDYNKYVVNAGITVGSMLRAWEDFPVAHHLTLKLPESGGPLPDFLAEVKFETDWLLTMQAADGSVYTKVSTERFGAFIPPENETTPRYFCPWGSPATANFVAVLAQAARAFQPYVPDYAARCLAAARKSQEFLAAHPTDHAPDQTAFHTGGYSTTDPDDRLWAVTELWQTTGDAALLKEVEYRIRELGAKFAENFDWAEVQDLALLTYLRSDRPGRDPALVATLRQSLITVADAIADKARRHGYGRPLGTLYYWGGNGGVARQTLLLQGAYQFTQNRAYREAALDAVNHLLGRNVDGRSYVTGLGYAPPRHPHDRRSGWGKVDQPWPGYLVGGPNPTAHDWHDVQPDARTNEIAINWNGALIYALAGFVSDDSVATK